MPIYALDDLEPRIDPSAFVHPDAVVIGNVVVGREASIWPSAVLRGDYGPITIGDRTSIQDGSVIHVADHTGTHVGAGCVIGHLVHLEGCIIEDSVLVGTGAVVLPEVVIRTGALVGAGAVVPQGMEVPSRAMALGIPAKVRPDAVDPDQAVAHGAASYVERSRLFMAKMRRLD